MCWRIMLDVATKCLIDGSNTRDTNMLKKNKWMGNTSDI